MILTMEIHAFPRPFASALAASILTCGLSAPALCLHAAESTPTAVSADSASPASAASLESVAGQLRSLAAKLDRLERQNQDLTEAARLAREKEEARSREFQQIRSRLEAQVQTLESRLATLAPVPASGPSAPAATNNAALVQDLDQRLRIQERRQELATEAAEAKAKEAPRLSLNDKGLTFSSADTNFVVKLRGILQLDARAFLGDNELSRGNDTFLVRRARPVVEATVYKDFDLLLVPDFGGSSPTIFDAYLNYKLAPEIQVRAGKFRPPLGLEQLQQDATLSFSERSFVSGMMPTRDLGIQVWGELGESALTWAAGVFNGVGDGRNPSGTDVDDSKEFTGRVFGKPWAHSSVSALQGFGIGLSGSYSQTSASALDLPGTTGGSLPGYTTDGQQQWFAYNPASGTVLADGEHWRLVPQVSYLNGSIGVVAEYLVAHQGVANAALARSAVLENQAMQVAAQWVLTGENASLQGIVPARPFTIHGDGWGAWQLVARHEHAWIDSSAFQGFANPDLSASEAVAWAVGLNWWLNKNARVVTTFTHTTFEGGGLFNPAVSATRQAPATVTHQDENLLSMRLQLSF